ncbi:hypothetical protein BCR42DRAFT_415658 [Absidia repens]|uniref:SH3 domain-containing protein n=1 Tax=Absidia repens TaxID=90262 RepID=A0A1X2IH43_9FUNG|nr:hypothetical protein BCR42DRAFT_415658 [Absidia repens]
MTLSSISNFTVLIKRIARKSSLRRKITTKKQRSRSYHHHTTTITSHDQDLASVSTCSSIEDEKHQINTKDVAINIKNGSRIDSLVTTTIVLEKDDDDNDNDDDAAEHHSEPTMNDNLPTTTTTTITTLSINNDPEEEYSTDNGTTVRDFAYPESSPLHYGQQPFQSDSFGNESQISLSSSRFNGCQAKALYDFTPETDHEIGMKSGQTIWIQYRQCAGWLIADVDDDTGLIPESYVEFI